MTPNERNAPVPANRVIDEPWRTAVTDALFARVNELTRLSRTGMNPRTTLRRWHHACIALRTCYHWPPPRQPPRATPHDARN